MGVASWPPAEVAQAFRTSIEGKLTSDIRWCGGRADHALGSHAGGARETSLCIGKVFVAIGTFERFGVLRGRVQNQQMRSWGNPLRIVDGERDHRTAPWRRVVRNPDPLTLRRSPSSASQASPTKVAACLVFAVAPDREVGVCE
jgi:hypothetical protein